MAFSLTSIKNVIVGIVIFFLVLGGITMLHPILNHFINLFDVTSGLYLFAVVMQWLTYIFFLVFIPIMIITNKKINIGGD